jgi:Ser/Thr protein kinase RdoA (MazF antagonist)
VLRNANRVAVRFAPCEIVARVGPLSYRGGLEYEVEIGDRLARTGAPVAGPDPRVDPRVHVRDDFAVTLWTYYQPLPRAVAPAEYAEALARLHAGMRRVEMQTPHFTDRVTGALQLLTDPAQTPDLADADRALLDGALRRLTSAITDLDADEQLLHGEPHPGNVLRASDGLRFIDLETCCRGPVEFDIAHGLLPNDQGAVLTAEELRAHYDGADVDAIELSRTLIWAMITTWRWRHDDELPNREHWRTEGMRQLRLRDR